LGFQANIALASNPDAAYHAALGFAGISILPYGDEAKYLASLAVGLLPPENEMAATLERWGIRTFRDLAALPELGVSARLGSEGVRLQQLARGEGSRRLRPIEDPLRFEEELEPEYPIALLDPLSFLLAQMLTTLCARLAERALSTNELHLRMRLENGGEHESRLRLPVPLRDWKALLKLLQLDLNGRPPEAPVVHIWLSTEPLKPRVTQNGLFIPLAPEPEKLELTLARIGGVVGKHNAGSPELVDTHRPGAFRMRPFSTTQTRVQTQVPERTQLAFRVYRPPRAAQVNASSGQPARLTATGIHGKVVSLAGPWRTSGDWWTTQAWRRDEWDVALSDGALYRIFCDCQTGRWYVEGNYD
jgi:protein ImuB